LTTIGLKDRWRPWITWFLVGGDFYTAYTVIAVPALVYALGAYGFFALPYTILVYPIVFLIMPKLWHAAQKAGHVTAADVVYGRYLSRPLEFAIALTGVVATMPYIALQLVGMEVVIKALGQTGELPLAAAFVILALYTYSAGLRAPALIVGADTAVRHAGTGLGDGRLHVSAHADRHLRRQDHRQEQ
jgi:SSS family solute:Na+ symporter